MEIPKIIKFLGFDRITSSVVEVEDRYRLLAKQFHPDVGGSDELFVQLKDLIEKTKQYLMGEVCL